MLYIAIQQFLLFSLQVNFKKNTRLQPSILIGFIFLYLLSYHFNPLHTAH